MRKNSVKNTRINSEVLKELSRIISREIKDPRIAPMTSVVSVEVAPDLKTCKAYISVLGDKEAQESTLEGLRSAHGYIRRELARSINLRNTPDVRFILDQSIEYGVSMSKKIDEINAAMHERKRGIGRMSTDKRENVTFAERKEEFERQVQTAQTIAISGHMNPDGDCFGSCLGLYTYIVEQYPEKEVTLFLEPVQDKFSFLKYADQITQEKKIDGPYDLFFSLDCSDTDRLHNFKGYFEEAKYKICVDHHFTNEGFGDLRFIVPDASSTCEVLFDMFAWDKISLECAQDLYMGIVHDTGVFKHTNTTRKTMETAGALLEKGIHSEDIIDRTFYKKSYVQNQILGRALMESIILLHGKVIFSIVRKRDFDFYGIDSSDLDGIIDQLRVTDGIECAILLYEKEDGNYKVSMRSNDAVDVSAIAKIFGGGGHIKAAGCTVHGQPRDIVMNITHMVEHQLNEQEEKQESIYDKRNS